MTTWEIANLAITFAFGLLAGIATAKCVILKRENRRLQEDKAMLALHVRRWETMSLPEIEMERRVGPILSWIHSDFNKKRLQEIIDAVNAKHNEIDMEGDRHAE